MVFEFGRELRRLFGGETVRDGLTGGDSSLLELLDLNLLKAEAKAADVAAGRVGCKDRPARQLEAAAAWREVARRTGDAVALRKAAACAENALLGFEAERRAEGVGRARLEQGACAMLGADLFGDEGLEAAAEAAFVEARRAGGATALVAEASLAEVAARRLAGAGPEAVEAAARRFDRALAALPARKALRPITRQARQARAETLLTAASRLQAEGLARRAASDLSALAHDLDPAVEPLAHAQATRSAAEARLRAAELTGDVAALAEAVADLAEGLNLVDRDHSPLDWARAQLSLAAALQSLGEAAECEKAFEQAVTCADRAILVLRGQPALGLSAQAAATRARCLARCAELTGDLAVLAAAETAYKTELAGGAHRRDPTAWALAQLGLAGLYETRMALTGRAGSDRAGAGLAYDAALEVFSERGLRSLSVLAAQGLERLRGL